MIDEKPPRDMVALAILLADIIGAGTPLGMLVKDGQKNKVAVAFEVADEFLKQSKEKT